MSKFIGIIVGAVAITVGVLIDIDTQSDLERFQQAYLHGTLSLELLQATDVAGRD